MTEGRGRIGKKLTTEMLAHVWTKLVPEAGSQPSGIRRLTTTATNLALCDG